MFGISIDEALAQSQKRLSEYARNILEENHPEVVREIERLKAENARYREALEFTVDMLKACQPWVTSYGVRHDSEKALEIAGEALKGGE